MAPNDAALWVRRGEPCSRPRYNSALATVGALELAVAYAKEREQFGKPIGAFQAVKHLCADMAGRAEVCRAAVYMAGCTLDDPEVGDV